MNSNRSGGDLQIDIDRSDAVNDGGWGINEDIVTIRSDSAWVLDGATGLGDVNCTPGNSAGRWYVEEFNAYLEETVGKQKLSLEEIVHQGIKEVANQFEAYCSNREIDKAHLPSATCGICRLNSDMLEVFVLGDCSILVSRTDGQVDRVYDDRIDALDAEVATQIQHLVTDEGLSILNAREECMTLLRANRRKKNTENGYWALGMDPRPSTEAIEKTFSIRVDDIIYGMTDGFGALVDTYERFSSWRNALIFLNEAGLEEGLNRIRTTENKDPECVRYPRTKPQDDATAFQVGFIKD